MALIQTQLKDRVGTLAFDHYAKRNALGADLIGEMLGHLDEFARQGVGAVVIRSAGREPVWSSGHDVDELPLGDVDPIPYDEPLEMLLRTVKRFPAPAIAMVHGSVWGGAFDLVMACDIVLSDETGAFAITPAKLGLPYNTNGFLNFMSRAPLGIVKEMFFTADPISAERALRAGFVNEVIPEAELEERTYAMARTIASRSAAAVAAAKQAIHELSDAVTISPSTYESSTACAATPISDLSTARAYKPSCRSARRTSRARALAQPEKAAKPATIHRRRVKPSHARAGKE